MRSTTWLVLELLSSLTCTPWIICHGIGPSQMLLASRRLPSRPSCVCMAKKRGKRGQQPARSTGCWRVQRGGSISLQQSPGHRSGSSFRPLPRRSRQFCFRNHPRLIAPQAVPHLADRGWERMVVLHRLLLLQLAARTGSVCSSPGHLHRTLAEHCASLTTCTKYIVTQTVPKAVAVVSHRLHSAAAAASTPHVGSPAAKTRTRHSSLETARSMVCFQRGN